MTTRPTRTAGPNGVVPNGRNVPYPPYQNEGTTQPKFDARVDYDAPDGAKLSMSGGVAGTSGIMQSGIGPFNINSGSYQSYGKVDYTKKAFKLQAFLNVLNGNADQLLTTDALGRPITFVFDTKTFDVEVGNVTTIGTHHALTYGGNIRYNSFDLSIAPNADNRTEGGALSAGRGLPQRPVPAVAGRAPRQVLVDQRRGVLAARGARDAPECGQHVPRLVQPRLPLAVGDQQLHQRHRSRSRFRSR